MTPTVSAWRCGTSTAATDFTAVLAGHDAAKGRRPIRCAGRRRSRAQLETVIVDLTANGRDAMPAGGRLTIRTAVMPPVPGEHNGLVTISVTDTDEGMPGHVRDRVCEPFFTGASSRGSRSSWFPALRHPHVGRQRGHGGARRDAPG